LLANGWAHPPPGGLSLIIEPKPIKGNENSNRQAHRRSGGAGV